MQFRTRRVIICGARSITLMIFLAITGCSLAPQPGAPPQLRTIPDQVVPAEAPFSALDLNQFLDNPDERAQHEWAISGQQSLTVAVDESLAQVQAPAGWTGHESLQLSVCDRWEQCDTTEVSFIRPKPDDLLIGFLGIDGFFIAYQDTRILIDALIDPSLHSDTTVTDAILGGEEPFNTIDLMLITHDHSDHFEANSVLRFLRSHPETELVSTSQVVAALMSELEGNESLRERLFAVEFDGQDQIDMTVNQVRLTIFDLPHPGSDRRENHGFMLHLGDLELLHTGDFNYISSLPMDHYPFGGYPVDYGFLPTIMINDRTYQPIQDWLGDGTLIPMHYTFSGFYAAQSAIEIQETRALFPDGIYFTHELQYWLGP